MQIADYKVSAVASVATALRQTDVKVSNERRLLYPRMLCAPWRHLLGAAHVSRVQVREPCGSYSATNVVVCLWKQEEGERVGFWAGDAFLSACKTSVSAAQRRAEAASARSARPKDALEAFLSAHALYPTATDCGFWKAWRHDRSISPHVAAVLARHHLNGHRVLDELREIVAQFSD